MTRVELSLTTVEDLDRMIVTHSLPANTRARVQRSLRILEQFPLVGRQLEGRWKPLRFILGPWRWLLLVYVHDEQQDVVFVLTIQDARSSVSVTNLIDPR
ncbi:MAG: type II toxin-antitoxin system RelE family toxin [Solirubrobacteraceae bacterium]